MKGTKERRGLSRENNLAVIKNYLRSSLQHVIPHTQLFLCFVQEKRSLPSDREPTVKRAFKSFVEERDDKYTMELLLLPSALKEELLGLVHTPMNANTSSLVSVNIFWQHVEHDRCDPRVFDDNCKFQRE